MKTIISVDNLKCEGCAGSIKNGLLAIKPVNALKVNVTEGTVEVDYEGADTLASIKAMLKDMGYPETGTLGGFDKVSASVKSYVSCAIGKFNKNEKQ